MGKRKNKKNNNFSLSVNTSCSDYLSDHSIQGNFTTPSNEISTHFKVLLSYLTDDKDKHKTWTKNCYWKNIVFVHPSVLRDLGCPEFLILRGEVNWSVFIALPLKSVKPQAIILLNDYGFTHEDLVSLHPVIGDRQKAGKIFVDAPSKLHESSNLEEILMKELSCRLIWSGLKIHISMFDEKYECIVTKVEALPKEVSESIYFDDSLNSENNRSVKEISSLLSSIHIQDSKTYVENSPEIVPFSMHYRTLLIINKSSIEETVFPLWKPEDVSQTLSKVVEKYVKISSSEKVSKQLLLLSGLCSLSKEMSINSICNSKLAPIVTIDLIPLSCRENSLVIEEFKSASKKATNWAPSVLLLRKLDVYYSIKGKKIFNLLWHLFENCGDRVLILASVNSELAVEIKEKFTLLTIQEINAPLPTYHDREELIKHCLIEKNHSLSTTEIKQCAELSLGMEGEYLLRSMKYDAHVLSKTRKKNVVSNTDYLITFCNAETAIKEKKSSCGISTMKTEKVQWSDICGMEAVKVKLVQEMNLIQRLQSNEEISERFNYSSEIQGILLYGPPGCSKTMIAKALATECNWNFISKKTSEIMNMYFGESEKAIIKLFLDARALAPCIIFLDEIDAIASARTSSSSGVQNRVVNCLLTEMSGIKSLKNVMVIAATNRPDIIDPALLRSGRIGHHIYVPLPDTNTRRQLFKKSMKRRHSSPDIDYEHLVRKTEGYTSAEIVQLCNEAAMQLLIEDPECTSPVFGRKHFDRALLAVPPRTPKEAIMFYEQFAMK